MAVPTKMSDLSITAASNSPAGSEAPISTDDFHRAIQGILRTTNAKGSDIASATTTDIGAATAEFVDVTGTTTITGLGTIAAGIVRDVRFTGALTLTHNGTSLILPGAANITTAANDTARFRSLGSGNWLCMEYKRQSGVAVVATAFNGGTITSDITMSAATDKWAKGADVASATALPLITDGNYFDVTGTTTVTSFNSVGVGTWVRLHFDSSLTLTHNATDLILPNGTNIVTNAGDEAEFIEYASGDYRCVSYTKSAEPIFAARNSTAQTVVSAAPTKVTLGTEIYDTNTNFASDRFTPTVAGYYQINGIIRGAATSMTNVNVVLYVNGSAYRQGGTINLASATTSQHVVVSDVILFNGSTDYVELWGSVTGTNPTFDYVSASIGCEFSGHFIRPT
jgi:hypothetical protein